MAEHRCLRVCIDARVPDGPASGVRSVVVGLAKALSELGDGTEEYLFLAFKDSHEWLCPLMKGRSRILPTRNRKNPAWKRIARGMPGVVKTWQSVCRQKMLTIERSMPVSDGAVEAAAVDVVHFAQTSGFQTTLPSIYQIHDLQHLHYPDFFAPWEFADREFRYRANCTQSSLIAVMTEFGKEDLIRNYGLPEEKVKVVPWAPVLTEYQRSPTSADLEATRKKFQIQTDFAFYPAQTWRHKNHSALFEALAILRDRYDTVVRLVCSGHKNEYYPSLQRMIGELGLSNTVNFVGYVSPVERDCLYRLARCMVYPSKFEGWGLPISEAFTLGLPVLCSNIRPLREQVQDAAITFDPDNAEELAHALYRVWTDENLRRNLRNAGTERAGLFSWDRTARLFRAHYRVLGRRPLTEEDRMLLAQAPLV